MAVHVLYLYHTLPWLRAVLYEYSCTVILVPVQLYRLYLVLPNTCNLLHAEIPTAVTPTTAVVAPKYMYSNISLSTQHLQLGVTTVLVYILDIS